MVGGLVGGSKSCFKDCLKQQTNRLAEFFYSLAKFLSWMTRLEILLAHVLVVNLAHPKLVLLYALL